jgi:hypothetical protein
MTFDLENARAADEVLPYPLDAKEIWVSGKGQMHINPPNAPSIFFTLSDLCEFRNIFHGQAAEIERLLGEKAFLEKVVHIKNTRLKELEDELVKERTGAIRCESYNHCEGMYEIDLPNAIIRAQTELQAEGKIGPDADAKPRVWQITDERKAAIKELSELLTAIGCPSCHYYIQKNYGEDITVLRAMLKEADHDKP